MNKKFIPYSKHSINKFDIKSVISVLKSGWLTQGPKVPLFEKKISKYVGAKYAIAVNSATSGLHLCCKALGVKKNDIVWTTSNTFISTANVALLCGAKIDFVDIDINTNNICIQKLKEKLEKTKTKNLPKILIPVHIGGYSCDMKKISDLSKKYNFKVIEDASHALGSKYYNHKVGSCKFSEMTVFSFHPVKNITTGEGGMILTNKKILSDKVRSLRTHGINYDTTKFENKLSNLKGYYQQIDLGLNYRMSDISAALGISQLKRLKVFLKKRNLIAKYYEKELENLPLIKPIINKNYYSAFHLYIIKINTKNSFVLRDRIFNKLLKSNFKVNIHYIPVHTHPYYKKLGFKKNQFNDSLKYYKTAISIPIFPDLRKKDQNRIIQIIKSFFINEFK